MTFLCNVPVRKHRCFFCTFSYIFFAQHLFWLVSHSGVCECVFVSFCDCQLQQKSVDFKTHQNVDSVLSFPLSFASLLICLRNNSNSNSNSNNVLGQTNCYGQLRYHS